MYYMSFPTIYLLYIRFLLLIEKVVEENPHLKLLKLSGKNHRSKSNPHHPYSKPSPITFTTCMSIYSHAQLLYICNCPLSSFLLPPPLPLSAEDFNGSSWQKTPWENLAATKKETTREHGQSKKTRSLWTTFESMVKEIGDPFPRQPVGILTVFFKTYNNGRPETHGNIYMYI